MSKISEELKTKIGKSAKNRCGYCLINQEIYPLKLEIEHILPLAEGGDDKEENLWLACRSCNSYKHKKTEAIDEISGQIVKIFNPRTQNWKEHFKFSNDKTKIIGKTEIGRVTVSALKLNNNLSVDMRKKWVEVGWYPPIDVLN